MTMNLRSDDKFVQDKGWYQAAERYDDFVRQHQQGKILYLDLGVGFSTPTIIKYSFWRMTHQNPNATYACVNLGQAFCPDVIRRQSICIDDDIDMVMKKLLLVSAVQGANQKNARHLESVARM